MALDGNDFKFDASKVYGGVSQISGALDPFSMAIDLVGNTLGLPPAVRNAAKVGIGVLTANPMMVISGGTGLAAEATKQDPATTEYCPPKSDERGAACCQGYASTSAPPPPQYGPAERFDMNSEAFAKWHPSNPYLKQLHDNYLAAKCGKHPNGLTEHEAKRTLETAMKYSLERDPGTRAEFESYFKVQVVDPKVDQYGDIVVRPLVSGCPDQWASISMRDLPRYGSTSSTDGTSGTYSSAASHSTDSSIDRMSSRLDKMDCDINALLEKDDLTQAEQLKLQRLMQKQQQLSTLISTLMSIQNQMAMTAINNMKG